MRLAKFWKTKTAKEQFHAAKKPINNWDVNVDNAVISKLKQKLIPSIWLDI